MDIAILPNVLFERLHVDPARRVHWNVLLSHVLLLCGAWVVACFPGLLAAVPHVCLCQWLFDAPCPGCGVVRSAMLLCDGDVVGAWALNPAAVVACAAMLVQIPLRLVALSAPRRSDRVVFTSRVTTLVAVVALVAHWSWQIL